MQQKAAALRRKLVQPQMQQCLQARCARAAGCKHICSDFNVLVHASERRSCDKRRGKESFTQPASGDVTVRAPRRMAARRAQTCQLGPAQKLIQLAAWLLARGVVSTVLCCWDAPVLALLYL